MIQKLFGVDLIQFGKELGIIALFNLIWIGIWYFSFRFTAKFIKNTIENIKDKEINRLVDERNEYQKFFMGKLMLTSKKKMTKRNRGLK